MSEQVELDRLADYAAGLLDGTPDAVEIAALIADDPDWGAAYTRLTEADERIRAELTALGEETATDGIPLDIAARLSAALADARRDKNEDKNEDEDEDEDEGAERTDAGANVVSIDAQRRRRRRRWASIAAVAAGVVAFAAIGLPQLTGGEQQDGGDESASTLSGGAGTQDNSGKAAPVAPDAATADPTGLTLLATGADYRRETLREASTLRAGGDTANRMGVATESQPVGRVPEELNRLADPDARKACLEALAATFSGRPQAVDYARFEGSPALVVLLVDVRSVPSYVVVTGVGCGMPGRGADVRYSLAVG